MARAASLLPLGFGRVDPARERMARAGDGYPPFNLERVAGLDGGDQVLRISLAVAGFGPEDLEVTVAENRLSISGRRVEEPGRDYLYRGIAARPFHRTFLLADGIDVVAAELRDGLLSVDLARPAARAARTVRINGLASSEGAARE